MQTMHPVDPATATGKAKELLDFVEKRTGRIPNMVRLMVNSPAALRFAAKVVETRGHVGAADVAALHEAGFSDGEVAEVIAVVVLNTYRSFFNLVARPEIDFPVVRAGY